MRKKGCRKKTTRNLIFRWPDVWNWLQSQDQALEHKTETVEWLTQEQVGLLCQQAGIKAETGTTVARWVEDTSKEGDSDVTNVSLAISDIKTTL